MFCRRNKYKHSVTVSKLPGESLFCRRKTKKQKHIQRDSVEFQLNLCSAEKKEKKNPNKTNKQQQDTRSNRILGTFLFCSKKKRQAVNVSVHHCSAASRHRLESVEKPSLQKPPSLCYSLQLKSCIAVTTETAFTVLLTPTEVVYSHHYRNSLHCATYCS